MNQNQNTVENLNTHFSHAVDLTRTAFPPVATVEPVDSGFYPFVARELPSVLDRVETPVLVEVNGREVLHAASARTLWGSAVEVTFGGSGEVVVLDAFDAVGFFGPPTVLDAPDGVIAYVGDGELLCADHGAPFDIGVEHGDVSPIFEHDGSNLDAVEWCSGTHNRDGHSFCGSCGEYMETTKGAHDREVEGPFARCSNCDTTSVFVDGEGFQYVNGWNYATESHAVEVNGVDIPYRSDLDGTTRVDVIDADNAPGTWTPLRKMQAFVAWIDLDPSKPTMMILAESIDEADETADYYFEVEHFDASAAADENEAEEMLAHFRASITVQRVDVEAITFASKR